MNEIKKCSIAGVSFTLENDAYDVLSTYIESLKETYKDDPDGEEILADIEARIAELILSAQSSESIICRPLIDNIIKQLGSASQIDEEHGEQTRHAETTDHNGNPRIPRRLYRDMENGKLGGVCAGLANYFDADPTWIRLAVFAPLFVWVCGSIGIMHWIRPLTGNLFVLVVLGYIIMWFAVPRASSARQKLEMKGERITAKSIKEATQETQYAAAEPERTLIAKIVCVLGNILLILLKIFAAFILVGLVLGASMLGLVMVCCLPMFALDFFTGLMLLAFLLVLIIPIVVLIYLSILLLISRRPSGRFLLGTLLVWIALLVTMTISAVKSPASFERQISNAFSSVFDNDSEVLYDEFTEEEIRDFREKINGQSTAMFSNGDISFSISGDDDDVAVFSKGVRIDDDGLMVSDGKGNELTISDDGVKINGKKTSKFTFKFGGVSVKINDNALSVTANDGTAAEASETAEGKAAETSETSAEAAPESAANAAAAAETNAATAETNATATEANAAPAEANTAE